MSISCHKCTTLEQGAVDNGGGGTCVGAEGIMEISRSSQFFCKPEAKLKIV